MIVKSSLKIVLEIMMLIMISLFCITKSSSSIQNLKAKDYKYALTIKSTDKIIYVSSKGNDSNDGFSESKPKVTIQNAMDTASQYIKTQNVVIDIEEGNYNIDAPISITDKNTSGDKKFKLVLYGDGNVNLVGKANELLNIKGTDNSSVATLASNVDIFNINFSGLVEDKNKEELEEVNSLNVIKDSAVNVEYASNITIDSCEFYNVNSSAIAIKDYTYNTTVKNNKINNISGSGILIGVKNNTVDDQRNLTDDFNNVYTLKTGDDGINRIPCKINVTDNWINDIGKVENMSVGIGVQSANSVNLNNNTIENIPYVGVLTRGGSDNYKKNMSGKINIEKNQISGFMRIVPDGAGVFSEGVFNDIITIGKNYIKNSESKEVGTGICLGKGTNNAIVENNVVEDCKNWIDVSKINEEENNTIVKNNHSNITLSEEYNRILDNTVGGTEAHFENNTINDNTWNTQAKAIMAETGAQDMFSVHINYATTENYTKLVTITANREMQEIPEWIISDDKRTMTKEYKENKSEDIIIKDTQGNQIKANINVTGVGERAKLHLSYGTKLSADKRSSEVTITANKELQEVKDWHLSTDKKTLTRTYTENGDYEVLVKDLDGIEANVTFTISGIGKVNFELTVQKVLSADKKSCKVTIISNKEVQEVPEWDISEDKKKLTKTFDKNGTQNVTLKDLEGNEKTIPITISEIENNNNNPENDNKNQLTVSKSVADDKKSCEVKIKSNKELEEIKDWTISKDKKELIRTFTENGKYNVTVKDLEGNQETVNFEIIEIDRPVQGISSKTYVIENNVIRTIQPNTKYEEFKKNISSEKDYEVIENGKSISGSDIMKTGQKLTENGTIYTIIVDGDTNGDGLAGLEDIKNINDHRFNRTQLKDEYLIAANVNKDNKVDIEDIFNINKFRLGRINSLNEKILNKAYALINISGTKSEAKIGDTFEVTVSTKCDNGINGIASEFTYDNKILELVECKVLDKFYHINPGSTSSVEVINKEGAITDSGIYSLVFKVRDTAVVGETTKVNIGRIAVNSDNAGETVGEGQPISVTIKAGNNNSGNNNQNSNNNGGNNNSGNNNENNNQNSNNNGGNNNQNSNNNNGNKVTSDINNISKDSQEYYREPDSSKKQDYDNEYNNKYNNNYNNNYNNSNDTTTAIRRIPQTGVRSIALSVVGLLSILAIFFYRKMKKIDKN